MFRLSAGDLWRGLVVAIASALFVAIHSVIGTVINTPDFDVFTVDYIYVLKELVNTSVVVGYSAGMGYLIKNLLTDESGNVLKIETHS